MPHSLDHVVLLGLNYQRSRSTGDKNFWVDLVPLLAGRIPRITILSVKDHHTAEERTTINGCELRIKYIRPAFLEGPNGAAGKRRIFWKGGAYPRGWGLLEKLLVARALLKTLRSVHAETPFQHVHLMDNFGLANRILATKVPATVSVSAMAYQGDRITPIYDAFLAWVFSHDNLWVVPYSLAYRDKLLQLDVAPERVCRIPWGVDSSAKKPDAPISRRRDRPLFLWAGYVQQIGRADFLYALHMAQAAIARGLNADFFFAFKPESFEREFAVHHRPEAGLSVKTTTAEEFAELKQAASVFFSPVVKRNIILAPPLTWLELLGNGVPIVTTRVPGAAEAVIHGQTGYVADSDQELMAAIFSVAESCASMRRSCVELCQRDYHLEAVRNQYVAFWRGLSEMRICPGG
jgi:glycosyltransferase involved in cell wall biosynthesis